jgi:hypothetical protein
MSENTETVTDATSVDENTTSTETPAGIAADLDMTIDEILKLNEQDFSEFKDDANHKGMKPLHHWLKNVPEDVRKHIANLRADYSRKTQALAAEKQEVEKLRGELYATRDGVINGPLAKMVKDVDTSTEYDMFDPEGMKAEIKRQATLMLQEMLKPAQEEVHAQQRRNQLEKFKQENPELTSDEYRLPVAKMLQDRPELKLEDAFFIVKAKVESMKIKAREQELANQKASRAQTLKKTAPGSNVTPQGTPKFKDAWEAFQYHKLMSK